jgi:hypothetical protein
MQLIWLVRGLVAGGNIGNCGGEKVNDVRITGVPWKKNQVLVLVYKPEIDFGFFHGYLRVLPASGPLAGHGGADYRVRKSEDENPAIFVSP